MNKYQECLLSKLGFILCSTEELSDISQTIRNKASTKKKYLEFDKANGILIINQYDDITITKYALVLGKEVVKALNKLYVLKNGEWTEISIANISTKNSFGHTFGFDNPQGYIVPIDFDDKADKLKITFVNNIADDYIIELKFVEADKDLYYQKQAETRRNTYIEAAQIKHSTGADLVNIYFQPCCANCGKTEVELYIAKGKYASPGRGTYVACARPLIGGEVQQLIGKFTVDGGFLFKSISGLANGVYAYRLRQFSKNDEMLFESDFQFFEIRP